MSATSADEIPDDDEDPTEARASYVPGQAMELLRGEIVSYAPSGWSRSATGSAGRHNFKFDDIKKAMYVRLIRSGVRRVRAAEYVGVTFATVLQHFKRFPDFLLAVSEAEMARLDEVEEALYETAIGGNVVAQQVVLFNRRPEEWADQRMMRARIEAAAAQEEATARRAAEDSLGGLREKLGELRGRLTKDDEPPTFAPEGEPVPVMSDDDDDDDDDDDGYIHAVPDAPAEPSPTATDASLTP